MRISGEEYIIVGRECNNCTAGMREVTDKYRENETNMAQDQYGTRPIKEHVEKQIYKRAVSSA